MDSTAQSDAEQKAAIEAGRLLFAQECGFVAATTTLERLPPDSLPEIAFAGRSNVGKSSLINALTGRKTLARTSNTPGRTQQLNFFDLGHRLLLVDLPGHGFAKVSKTQVRDWTRLVKDYLRGRVSLRRVCLLVDARHGLKDNDREVMTLLDQAAVVYQVVLTKADKTKPAELAATLEALSAELSKRTAAYPVLFPTSAVSGEGIPELRAELATLALQP
ncbi:MAG: ribosome biogenesis GTP-binding protein YihA/YsxC [Oceanibaculum sp.]